MAAGLSPQRPDPSAPPPSGRLVELRGWRFHFISDHVGGCLEAVKQFRFSREIEQEPSWGVEVGWWWRSCQSKKFRLLRTVGFGSIPWLLCFILLS